MESLIGRLGDALDAYDGQQTANTLQWTRRHLISAPQWWHEMTNRFAVWHEITAAAAA
jgi:hypothetical protein